jgi:hypothetical protein
MEDSQEGATISLLATVFPQQLVEGTECKQLAEVLTLIDIGYRALVRSTSQVCAIVLLPDPQPTVVTGSFAEARIMPSPSRLGLP